MKTEALTFFRFVAAITVVMFHFCGNSNIARAIPDFIGSGPVMVTFFFVLSGFVMVVAYYNKSEFSARKYWLNRIARIAPIYFVASAVTAYFLLISDGLEVVPLVLNLTFLQAWIPTYALSFNYPGWSLGAEVFFYAIFPAIILYLRKHKPPTRLVFIFSGILWLATQIIMIYLIKSGFYKGDNTASHDIIFYFPLSHICSFFLGIAGAYFLCNLNDDFFVKKVLSRCMPIMLIVTFTCLNYPRLIDNIVVVPPNNTSFYAPLFLLTIMCIALSDGILKKLLSSKVCVALGDASYSLYIMQVPIFYIFITYVAPILNPAGNTSFYIYIGFNVVASLITYKFIEKPAKYFILNLAQFISGKSVPSKIKQSTNLAEIADEHA